MPSLLRFSRAIDRMNAGVAVFADYFVLIAVLVSAGNATLLWLVGRLPAWLNPIPDGILNNFSNSFLEIQWYLFAAVVMLGASYTLKLNEHVRVDIVYSSLTERGRLFVDVFGLAVFLLPVIGYFVFLSWPFFWRSYASGEMSNNAGGLILWPAKLVLPLGFALLWLQGLSELIKRVAALKGLIRLETKYDKPLQ
ncbi:sugar transporter [Aureimonas sp. Leaf454]|uniref:TRAP transporter small permease subunit n=1 Tax=Aureimonas sp. Leaf454 TaxID=1736381 RepID=UPI0006FF69BF|nr:TRAP transporter small permease subunit [Aureimonas sp. Leaf454]KQT48742.1 sugar transporter [Aureimonas sp. Leaf454]